MRLQAVERYGVLGNAQGEVGDLAARKGKGLASSASARVRARHTHGVATAAAAARLSNGGVASTAEGHGVGGARCRQEKITTSKKKGHG
jgi:hypothetical protein